MGILRSPIFYMGNKFKLMKDLKELFPKECNTFVDLFGGSGVVSMNYQGKVKTIYNEFNDNIVELIKMIVNNDPKELDKYWREKIEYYNLPNMSIKSEDRKSREGYEERFDNYMRMRDDYNKSRERDYRDLFLLTCYSINNLIRFNKESQFNVSSGAGSYNYKNFRDVKNMNKVFKNVEIINGNAFDFDFDSLTSNDFIYCDPPYLNTLAVYNEGRAFGGWDIECDYKLFNILEKLNERGVMIGMSNVFYNRGKENTHLIKWCKDNNFRVIHLDRNYNPFSRGNSDNDEVYIYNYEKEIIDEVKLW